MKILLVGINSKYIHTCLAVWYLKASLKNCTDSSIREFSINDHKDDILSGIYMEKPDILAFSCYIWNFELVRSILKEIKKLLPECKIILGGPEVSYTAVEILQENEAADFILCGEGEEAFPVLINSLITYTQEYKKLSGIAYRENGQVIYREGFNLVPQLDSLASPYTDEHLSSTKNRIIYYESSRGCPFSCSYCISSTFKGVRFFSLDRVKCDLERLISCKPKLIKFVDRTFNCNRKRAKEIIEYIISLKCNTVFHFETAADLFDQELLELLGRAPKGRIQLEIGLQTTNLQTLNEIERITDLDRLKENVGKILENENIHVHLDLIAGLPYEDIKSFKKSFNDVYAMRPHQLQLGFLKMLKGSKIRMEAQKHGYKFRDYSPYEILENNYISYMDILCLKDMEEVFERYFNTGRFSKSLEMLEPLYSGDFYELFRELAVYCRKNRYLDRPVSYRENISVLFDFVKSYFFEKIDLEKFRQAMVFDFLSSDSSCAIPEIIKAQQDLLSGNLTHELLKSEDFVKEYLPDAIGISAKNILKRVFFVSLHKLTGPGKILMFDYQRKDPVHGKYSSTAVVYDN